MLLASSLCFQAAKLTAICPTKQELLRHSGMMAEHSSKLPFVQAFTDHHHSLAITIKRGFSLNRKTHEKTFSFPTKHTSVNKGRILEICHCKTFVLPTHLLPPSSLALSFGLSSTCLWPLFKTGYWPGCLLSYYTITLSIFYSDTSGSIPTDTWSRNDISAGRL